MAQTLDVLADDWVGGRYARGEIGARSGAVERSRLEGLVRAHGERLAGDLDRTCLLAWQASIGHLAPATRRSYLSTAVGFCRWMVIEGHLVTDPTLGLVRVREPRRVPRTLRAADVAAVLAVCADRRAAAVVWLMVGAGLRCVEVSNLDVADYDAPEATLHVRGKGGHERVLPVPGPVGAALDAYLAERGRGAGPLVRATGSKGAASGRLSARWLSQWVGRLMADAGVHAPGDGRAAHSLRRTAASDCLDACRDVRLVQQMLGHASLATTQVYLRRASLDQLRDAMEGRRYVA